MNEEENQGKFLSGFYDTIEDSAVGKFLDLSGEKKAAYDQAKREGKFGKVSQGLQVVIDVLEKSLGIAMTPVTKAVETVSDVTNVDERAVGNFVTAMLYGKGLVKKVPKIKTPERFKPVNKRTVNVKAETIGTEPTTSTSNIVPSKFIDSLKKRIGKPSIVKQGEAIFSGDLFRVTGGDVGSNEDSELMRRYKEINNPDSYITDKSDPDYGRLKSEVFAEREEISRRQEIERQRNLIIEAKGDNLLSMLTNDELQKVFPKSYRSFYNKLKPDKKGRFVDLRRKFNIKKIREMYPGDENEDFRRTVFALAADPRFSSTTFTKTRKQLIGEWLEGLDDIQERIFAETQNTKTLEAHHVNSIRHVASLFDGLDFNERIILRNRLLENMFPVGNNPDNLVLLNDKIHDEIHRQLDTQIGKFAEKFIDENKRYTIEQSLDIAKRMGTVVNQITQEAYDSMAEYMAQKFEEQSPSAKMAADMSINEVKPILESVLDEYRDFANRKAEESLRRAMEDLPQTQEGVLPVDLEDQPASKPTRLTRGKGKKTIERQRELEEKYGKQLEL